MKNISILLFVVLFAGLSFGQTALPSTTLSAAIDSKQTSIQVASATNITAGNTLLYVDREAIEVNTVNGTTLGVTRGYTGTKGKAHVSGATVYVGVTNGVYFSNFGSAGACTASDFAYLPRPVVSITSPMNGFLEDCYGGKFYYDLNLPLYTLTIAPGAQRSGTSPSAGSVISLTAQAGGAQSGTTAGGGAGGASSLVGGAGGIGGSASGTAGAGGAVAVTGGAGGAGPITGGAGGNATVKAGAGGNGSSAGGNGGNVVLQAGAVGTGGTGAAGKVQVKDAADPTKIAAFDVSNITTANTRTIIVPDVASVPIIPVMNHSASAVAAATLHIVRDTCTLGTSCTVTLTGAAVFADTNYVCSATDATAAAAVKIVNTSGSTVTITGTGTDVINYVCVGN